MGGSKAGSERFLTHLDFSPSPATGTCDLERGGPLNLSDPFAQQENGGISYFELLRELNTAVKSLSTASCYYYYFIAPVSTVPP